MDAYFHQHVFPVLTPLAFDPGRPFPHISNLSLNLAVVVRDQQGEEHFARVKVPDTLPQLVPVKAASGNSPASPSAPKVFKFVWLEQLIAANLGLLFPGMEIVESSPFRVTRDAEVAVQELESDDLLETIEEAMRERRFLAVVRLQVAQDMPEKILSILTSQIESQSPGRLPRRRAAGFRPVYGTLFPRPAGPEGQALCADDSRQPGRGLPGRSFQPDSPGRFPAAPPLRFLPAGGGVSAPGGARPQRARHQDDPLPGGEKLPHRRRPAGRRRGRQAGGRADGTEGALR